MLSSGATNQKSDSGSDSLFDYLCLWLVQR